MALTRNDASGVSPNGDAVHPADGNVTHLCQPASRAPPLITNDHVVAGFTSYQVTLPGGRKVAAQLVGQDPQNDLAVLKVTPISNLQPIVVGNSGALQVGTSSSQSATRSDCASPPRSAS